MATTVDANPARALLGADRDGLLTYHGFVSGGSYEVDVVGQRRVVAAADVPAVVERLRAVRRLRDAGVDVRLAGLREDGTHTVQFGDRGEMVALPADRVVDWCEGYLAAHRGEGQVHVGEDQIGKIAALLDDPSRDDQCRMVILGLMKGGPQEVSADRLIEMIRALDDGARPPARKTVIDALAFGGYLASDMAERMIAAFGMRWCVSAASGPCEPAEGGKLAAPLPEMPGLVALRRIADASRAGWLRYVDEPAPNKARWNRRYQLTVGGEGYVVSAEGLHAWLDGVAAFHAQRD